MLTFKEIAQVTKLPHELTGELDTRFKLWAIYRRGGKSNGRPVEPQLYELWQRGEKLSLVAKWELHQMPGCAGACVSIHSVVEPEWRGDKLGTFLNRLRCQLAKDLGYSVMLCTRVHKNYIEGKVLQRNGWADIDAFKNTRTGNLVVLSTKVL